MKLSASSSQMSLREYLDRLDFESPDEIKEQIEKVCGVCRKVFQQEFAKIKKGNEKNMLCSMKCLKIYVRGEEIIQSFKHMNRSLSRKVNNKVTKIKHKQAWK